jgi:hypothetical protein
VPKGKKNKDVTTSLLVDEGMGEELKKKILDTREAMVTVYTNLLNQHGDTLALERPKSRTYSKYR